MRLRVLAFTLLLASVANVSVAAEFPDPKKGFDFSALSETPVLSGGRLKPLDSYAREVVLHVTGSRVFQGWNPVELMVSWAVAPALWEELNFILISRADVKRQIGVEERRSHFSPKELVENSALAQYADRMGASASQPMQVGLAGAPKEDPREKELRAVMERVGMYRAVVSGDGWPLIPMPGDEAWHVLSSQEKDGGEEIRNPSAAMMISYREGKIEGFSKSVTAMGAAILARMENVTDRVHQSLRAEVFYNRFHPFRLAWVFYLFAVLAGALALGFQATLKGRGEKILKASCLTFAGTGVAVHVAGMVLRVFISERPPVTNMYESVIWVAFGAMVFGAILFGVTRQLILMVCAAAVATITLLIADSAPAVMDPSIRPLVPVLRSNLWLTIHVLTITLGYAAFALTLSLGNVTLFHYARLALGRGGAGRQAKILNLNQLTYRATQFGVVLLAAGTILGGVWADYSWGRFWGWDPKEVWALIALLGYIAILHARYTGWIGQFGYAAWTIVSFVLVLMAWYGVNFVLGAGLHAYGFSSGGQGTVAAFTFAQLAYVAVIAWLRKRKQAHS